MSDDIYSAGLTLASKARRCQILLRRITRGICINGRSKRRHAGEHGGLQLQQTAAPCQCSHEICCVMASQMALVLQMSRCYEAVSSRSWSVSAKLSHSVYGAGDDDDMVADLPVHVLCVYERYCLTGIVPVQCRWRRSRQCPPSRSFHLFATAASQSFFGRWRCTL